MNIDKAREYFSAYHEGTLDRGLRQSFEHRLSTDAQVQAEYKAFERTMQKLESLASPVPEPDFDLHELISARLDRHMHEAGRKTKFSLSEWWRSLALVGVAGGALAIVLMQMNHPTSTPGVGSNLIPVTHSTPYNVSVEAAQIHLRLPDAKDQVLHIDIENCRTADVTGSTGGIDQAFPRKVEGYLVSIRNEKTHEQFCLVVPGTQANTDKVQGTDSLKNCALALAGVLTQPVMLDASVANESVTWDFKSGDVVSAARIAVKKLDLTIDQAGELIRIIKH